MVGIGFGLFPLLIWLSGKLFTYLKWSVPNYLDDETPYNLGICLLGTSFIILGTSVKLIIFIYLSTLWLTGFIDDRFGTKYPKGLRGHFRLFFQTRKISTGLLKLASTVVAAAVFSGFFYNGTLAERIPAFILLVLGPHIINLFDTRPLRAWKVAAIHAIVFFPLLSELQEEVLLTIIFVIASLVFFEAKMMAMLGDNGATLLGGMINIVFIFYLSSTTQWLVVALYCLIILITERISLSELIEKTPLFKKIDRWGVS